ncbi:hypothetical protein Gpo141_00013242 [Globisporangium polare]
MVARREESARPSAADELSRRLRGDSNSGGGTRRQHHTPERGASHGQRNDSSSSARHPPATHVKISSTARRASILQRLLNSTGRVPLMDQIKRRGSDDDDDESSSSDDDDDSDRQLPQTIRRRVSRIFLQRFLKKQDVACEADFCLYFEIVPPGESVLEQDRSNASALRDWVRRRTSLGGRHEEDNDNVSGSVSSAPTPKKDNKTDVHTVIDITAMLLRDAGCQVMLYPLQHPDSELLPESKSEARAYVMTVGYADPSSSIPSSSNSSSKTTAIPEDQQTLHYQHHLPPHHQKLPAWVTLHPAYTKQILPLAGLAQTQQLTKLILKECRTDHNLFLADGELVFEAEKKVLSQLAAREDLTIQLYPLHRDDFRENMIRKWARHATYAPPLADIYAYYGPKIAMYFAWLDFYTTMLVFPSLCGLCVYAAGHFNAQSYSLLSFLLAIGTSVFVDLWRRKQREVEYTWKYQEAVETSSSSSLVPGLVGLDYIETRPEFQGEWMNDPVTHEIIYDFPRHKRLFRQLLAIPLLLSMCCAVGAYVVGLNMLSENLRAHYRPCFLKHGQHQHNSSNSTSSHSQAHAGHDIGTSPALCAFISHGPGVLNALIIYMMDLMYQQLAWRLNEFENYRTAQEFEDNLVLKRMPFHFVNSNASIWFLAFYVQNLERVRERLWILMVGMQLLDNFKEVGLPFVVSLTGEFLTADGKRRRSRGSSSSSMDVANGSQLSAKASNGTTATVGLRPTAPELKRQHTSQASAQERVARVLMQKRQAQYKDTFADYKEMMIQYGYVALYSPIFPLAPVFAWLNNVVESRSDFLKLVNTHSYQRPLVQHTRGIGVWEHVLVAFSVLAVIINFALVWTYELDDLLPSWSDLHRFMFIVGCEHLIFFIKVLLNWAAPDVPTWIQNEKRLAALHRTHEAAYAQHSELQSDGGGDSESDSEGEARRSIKPPAAGVLGVADEELPKDIHPYAVAS